MEPLSNENAERRYVAADEEQERLQVLSKISVRSLKTEDREVQGEGECCAICIEPYKVSETLRSLPCRHDFHKNCIDLWFLKHSTCPMCKMDIFKHYGFVGSEESILQLEEGGDYSQMEDQLLSEEEIEELHRTWVAIEVEETRIQMDEEAAEIARREREEELSQMEDLARIHMEEEELARRDWEELGEIGDLARIHMEEEELARSEWEEEARIYMKEEEELARSQREEEARIHMEEEELARSEWEEETRIQEEEELARSEWEEEARIHMEDEELARSEWEEEARIHMEEEEKLARSEWEEARIHMED